MWNTEEVETSDKFNYLEYWNHLYGLNNVNVLELC